MRSDLPTLEVRGLDLRFPGSPPVHAVRDLSFTLHPGRTLAVVGESGSGKSLTALSLIGLQPAKAEVSGALLLRRDGAERSLRALSAEKWAGVRGRDIGMVFQEPMSALNPLMTAGAQLSESIRTHRPVSAKAAESEAQDWLRRVQLPEATARRYPHELSGGQKQRLMIAMALCHRPALLIADEPTTALDVTVQRGVLLLLRSLLEANGTSLVFITHDLALAAEIADEVLVLWKGAAVEYGSAAQVLGSPQHPYTRALLACRPTGSQRGQRLPVVSDFLDPAQDAPAIPAPRASHSASSSDILLEARSLDVWFATRTDWRGRAVDYFKAAQDVSFALHRGASLGIVGESGSGKTTVGRALMGLVPLHGGQVLWQGRAVVTEPDWKALRRKVQLIFQDPASALDPRRTIAQLVGEPLHDHSARERSARVGQLLDQVQLPASFAGRYPHELSGGQKQRVGIARALALEPQVLICDESVSALDVSVQAQVLNLLNELKSALGLSFLFISHDLNVVNYFCDEVLVMQRGRVVEQGGTTQVIGHPQSEYTQRLVASAAGLV